MASLIDVEGTLYGTTAGGGKYGGGTVFSITTTGTKHILHNFGTAIGTDGSDPEASLIYVNGTLYGTTAAGGGPHGKLGEEQSLASVRRARSAYCTAFAADSTA